MFFKSDVELIPTDCIGVDGKRRIDGFRFISKRPLSKSYQWCSTIGLEYTYPILELIESGIKERKRAVMLEISIGMGVERIPFWKGSLPKLRNQFYDMIGKIQKQY